MNKKIRIVLADDHPIMTEGLKLTISSWEEFEVIGIASDGEKAVEMSVKLLPDLVITDMQMPKLSGAEIIKRLKEKIPGIRILAFTTFSDAETVSRAVKAGCDGFLLKVIEPEKLRASLLSIASGLNVYDEDVIKQMKKGLKEELGVVFSKREQEIIRYICQGMTNAEIADKLHLRPGTVKNIVSLLLSKCGCISRAQLVKYATGKGLVD